MLQDNKDRLKTKFRYVKMRADIERQLRGLKKFTREAYDKIVEDALTEYGKRSEISAAKLGLLEMELKDRWKEMKRRFEIATREETTEEADEDEE